MVPCLISDCGSDGICFFLCLGFLCRVSTSTGPVDAVRTGKIAFDGTCVYGGNGKWSTKA